MPGKRITPCAHCGTGFTHPRDGSCSTRYCSRACSIKAQGLVIDLASFMAKVDTDGPVPPHVPEIGQCWLWTGSRMKRTGRNIGEYGVVRYEQRTTSAHRLAWVLTNGPIPDGLYACHRCDNPPCCNPAHLFLGTAADNMRDASSKGRIPSGAANHARMHPEQMARGETKTGSVLTNASVIQMRERRAAGEILQSIASDFGVDTARVFRVTTGRLWRHVGGPITPVTRKRKRPQRTQ